MKSVGEILYQARIKKGLSLEQISKQTKIRVKFLLAIEENDFSKISNVTVIKGFIRNYAQVLDLNPEFVLAVFRRDFQEDEKGQIIPRGMVNRLDRFTFWWSPKLTVVLIFFVFFVVFFGLLIRQYLNFVSFPKITIVYPEENEVLRKSKVEFLGKTDKDASLYINGEIVNLGENGEFKKTVNLTEGENEIIFEAINRRGKKTRLIRKQKAEIP